jgi:hypothetical protein
VDSKISVGQQSCTVLTVPKDWELPPRHRDSWPFYTELGYLDYVFRRSTDNQTLYVGLYNPYGGDLAWPGEPFYSANKFAFNPGSNSLRTASEEQWNTAVPLEFVHGFLDSEVKGEIVYHRRLFPKKSSHASAMPSNTLGITSTRRDEPKWLTVFSFVDPPVNNRPPKQYSRILDFDIFRTASGQLMISGNATFSGVDPNTQDRLAPNGYAGYLAAKTGWYGDKYFVIPLENKKRKFLLCSMP